MATISWLFSALEMLIRPAVTKVFISERVFEYLVGRASRDDLKSFLKGFCCKYLFTTHPRTIAEHCLLALNLSKQHIQLKLKFCEDSYTLTVVTANRPGLGADILRVLTVRYDMNIRKWYPFVNSADIAVGIFHFKSEVKRSPAKIQHLLGDLYDCISGKLLPTPRPRMQPLRSESQAYFQTQVRFDDSRSRYSTFLHIESRDRQALLLDITSVLAYNGCDIRAAIVETDDSKAIDSFYLTKHGEKLDAATQSNLEETLLKL